MMLKVEGLTKQFGGLIAVNDINFEVKKGEIVGLIGPNGAGKTTLFNLINGFYSPTSGKIYFKGEDVTGKKPHKLCKKGIVRTFQVVRPLKRLTVMENVITAAFNRAKTLCEAKQRAQEVLDFLGLLPQSCMVAATLTLASRKMLEMARALATQPEIIMLDEVVAGLNPTEADMIIEKIQKVRDSGITILVVEHVMKVIMSISDRIIVLHHGDMLAEGRPDEIVNNVEVINAYLGESYA